MSSIRTAHRALGRAPPRLVFSAVSAALALGLSLAAAPASAALVDLTNLKGSWVDPVPLSNVTSNTGAGTATPQIRWGASGYDFAAAGNIVGVAVPPSPSATFVLGTFSHLNQPITAGSSLTQLDLIVNADITVDGSMAGNHQFRYRFNHEETDNAAAPCAYGPAGQTGVNRNGCADRVTVDYNVNSDSFMVGTSTYSLRIAGFEYGGVFASEFLTAERATNTALMIGQVALTSEIVGLVPEPATHAMMALALLGGAGFARRKR